MPDDEIEDDATARAFAEIERRSQAMVEGYRLSGGPAGRGPGREEAPSPGKKGRGEEGGSAAGDSTPAV